MYIFQPARVELSRQVGRHASAIRGRVLDVGSGPAPRYRSLFSCDEYIKLDVVAQEGVDVVGSAEALPFPDASFDSVVCTQVLGDVYDVHKAFAEFYRVLRPGGVALITEALFDSLHNEPNDYWRFTAHSLRRLATDAGFAVESLEPRGGFHSVKAQMNIRYCIERCDLYHAWYRRLANLCIRLYAQYLLWRDRRDRSRASRLFTHGFLLLARKP